MKKLLKGSVIAAALMPVLAFAQADAFSLLRTIKNFINQATPVLISAAVLYFIYGVVRFVIAADADDKEKARGVVIQGIIGLFVIVSLWGLVFFIGNTVGVGPTGGVGDITPFLVD